MTDQHQKNTSVSQVEEDEIDLIAIAKTLWEGRKTIVKTTLIFMGIGLFVAIFSEKEYTASTTFVPQTSDSKIGGNLGGLASLAGINLGGMSSGSEISPSLYPQIINSIAFQLEMLQTPLTIGDQKEKITFEEYYKNHYRPSVLGYIKKYTIGLPDLLIKGIIGDPKGLDAKTIQSGAKGYQYTELTKEQHDLIKIINDKVSLVVNEKEGFVSVSTRMPEAKPAAELALQAFELLQENIVMYKVQKSSEDLKFIEERSNEKEKDFFEIQKKLALYRDRNINLSSSLAKSTLRSLQSEYDLSFNIYNELLIKLENQKIQVKEDTPVFTVLTKPTVPIKKTSPKRFIILFLWIVLGGMVGAAKVLGKDYFFSLKSKWIIISSNTKSTMD